MDVDRVPEPDGVIDDRRREALKRFARYAAACPATMILLQPTESDAAPKKGKKGKKGGGHY